MSCRCGGRPQNLVREFHQSFGQPVALSPSPLPEERHRLRIDLIAEELDEYREALASHDVVAQADALADLLYVVYGAGVETGLDLDAVLAEVHRSNMTKLGPDGAPVYLPSGKVTKGPDYQPPDIPAVLGRQSLSVW